MNSTKSPSAKKTIPVITIDGPTCSGKGTISRILATKLGWNFLDSGVLYRALAYAVLKEPEVDLNKLSAIKELISRIQVTCSRGKKKSYTLPECHVFSQNKNITKKIRAELYSKKASEIAAIPLVRKAVLAWQRNFMLAPGLVADGRDMGTIVFPRAKLKIFLTAKEEIRARRRYEQLKTQGINVSLDRILKDLRARDKRDKQRKASPLVPAKDALIIDTSKLDINQVIEKITKIINN